MGQRHYPDKPRVYIDMDGVIADFGAECVKRAMTPSQLKNRRDAYRWLSPFPGAKEGLAALEGAGIEVFALTKIPSTNPYAATEKLLWMRDHFPKLADRVVITPDKGCVGTLRDVLVDDHPEWANADHFQGTVVPFEGDWARARSAVFSALDSRCPP